MAKRWLTCPKCAASWQWGYFKWILKAPFHWFNFTTWRDKRYTKCPCCGKRSWMYREK